MSCGLRETSRVDYTERRKTERKKFLYVFTITSSGPPQREEILRERKIKRFLNFIKQNYTDFEEEERLREFDSFVNVFPITLSAAHHREREGNFC